jgi:hypothetical protein
MSDQLVLQALPEHRELTQQYPVLLDQLDLKEILDRLVLIQQYPDPLDLQALKVPQDHREQ